MVTEKAKVHEIADKALKAGGKETYPPKDYGFMFARSFEDPDGHIWEAFWMDPAHVK
jgi:uncharacterized protein